MKKISILLIAGMLGLSLLACGGDHNGNGGTDSDADSDADNFGGADNYPFSCHYDNPYLDGNKQCFGIDVGSADEAKAICDDSWLGDVQYNEDGEELEQNKLDGGIKEGGCLEIAKEGHGYCISYKGNRAWSAGGFEDADATGEKMPREHDCDPGYQYSSAWGCEIAVGVAGEQFVGEWVCFN